MIPRRRTYFSLPPWQECTGNDDRGCALQKIKKNQSYSLSMCFVCPCVLTFDRLLKLHNLDRVVNIQEFNE